LKRNIPLELVLPQKLTSLQRLLVLSWQHLLLLLLLRLLLLAMLCRCHAAKVLPLLLRLLLLVMLRRCHAAKVLPLLLRLPIARSYRCAWHSDDKRGIESS
jgi:hypothetical protein